VTVFSLFSAPHFPDMKNFRLYAITILCFLSARMQAQTLAWEITLPDDKQQRGPVYADLNDPDAIYAVGDYTALRISLQDQRTELLEIGVNRCDRYFISDDEHAYTFLHAKNYYYNNFWTSSLLYSSARGQSKGLRKSIFKKERYMDMAGLRLINGDLYFIMGGGDPFNKRPLKSAIIRMNKNAKILSVTKVAFPMTPADDVIAKRQDKGYCLFPGAWRELDFNPRTSESTIFRFSAFKEEGFASIFKVNLLNPVPTEQLVCELPEMQPNRYVYDARVIPYYKGDEKEFILQLVVNKGCGKGVASNQILNDPQYIFIRYSMDGKIIAQSEEFPVKNVISNINETVAILPLTFDFITLAFDPLDNNFVLIQPNDVIHIFDENLVYKSSAGRPYPIDDKTLPQHLRYFLKIPENTAYRYIFFGKDYVITKYYREDDKQVVVTCFHP